MHRKMAGVVMLSCLFIFYSAIGTHAQEITPEKRELIEELIEITEVKEQAEKITDIMLLQMENNYGETIRQIMPGSDLFGDKDSEECRERTAESYKRFSKRFRELYPQRVNYMEVIEQIYYPLYDKYFTTDDLKYIIEFYKSPTGQKFIKIMPEFMKEGMQRSSEMLTPKIIELINEILQEEKEYLIESA